MNNEIIINEAAISVGYSRRDCIDMPDIVSAVLRSQYNSPDNDNVNSDFVSEAVVRAEFERYILKARDILIKTGRSWKRLHKRSLKSKLFLILTSEKIRESVTVVNADV